LQKEEYEDAVEKIREILGNVGRNEKKKGKSHVEELIRKQLTDDEYEALEHENGFISVLDDLYEEKGWNSEGEEENDEDA
jgi:hypothetical protein